jgi:opacity protein-like surface antigen
LEGDRKLLKQLTVIGLTGLALVAAPASADQASSVAGAVGMAVASALACAAGAISLDEEDPNDGYDRRGFFVNLGASSAIEQFDDEHAEPNRLDKLFNRFNKTKHEYVGWDSDSAAINAALGYRCHPRFSVEGEVNYVDGFKGDINRLFGNVHRATVDFQPIVVTTNLKGYLLTGRFQPWVQGGLGFMYARFKQIVHPKPVDQPELVTKSHDEKTRLALRAGGGLDFYATKNIVLQVKADYIHIPTLALHFLSIGGGVEYRF